MQVTQFLKAVQFVLHVEPGGETRPFGRTVAFDFQSDSLTLVTTDGRRLAAVELATIWAEEPRVFCVGREELAATVSQLGEAVGDLSFFPAGDGVLGAMAENFVSASISLSAVSFPDWRLVARANPAIVSELWVPAGQWAAAFTALAKYQEGHDTVCVEVGGAYRAVRVCSADGKACVMVMPCARPR